MHTSSQFLNTTLIIHDFHLFVLFVLIILHLFLIFPRIGKFPIAESEPSIIGTPIEKPSKNVFRAVNMDGIKSMFAHRYTLWVYRWSVKQYGRAKRQSVSLWLPYQQNAVA